MNISGPRSALLEIGEKYSDHADASIRGKANLSMLMAPGYDFLTHGNQTDLEQFKREFDQRLEHVIHDGNGSSRMIALTLFIHGRKESRTETWPISIAILERLEKDGPKEFQDLYQGFREHGLV